MKRFPGLGFLLIVALLVGAAAAACGSSSKSTNDGHNGGDAGMGGFVPDGAIAGFAITPATKTLNLSYGATTPTVQYKATLNGATVSATFAIDQATIGSVSAQGGLMTPAGTVGGTAHIIARYGNMSATATLDVLLLLVDNGAPPGTNTGGSGGVGGVGGNGAGGTVNTSTQTVLQETPTTDPGLGWLYPYDKTVWPRGILAPLLQWTGASAHNYDAVYVHMKETAFEYKGFFAANANPFVNTLIPPKAWAALSDSNQGEPVSVTLVFSFGGAAYGPLTETWTIAQGTLTGTVYYNSYGTNLVSNFCCTKSGVPFGGATLAIKHGAIAPTLVAGTNGPTSGPNANSGCRVCHSVSGQGSTLVTQHGDDYAASSAYALASANKQTDMLPADARFAFAALSPDGTFLFSNSAPVSGVNYTSDSSLFTAPGGAPIAATGIPAGLRAGTPVFSPDGTHIAFNDYGADMVSLAAIDYARASQTFSNKVTLHTPTSGVDVFPAFLPTSDAIVFELETQSDGEFGATRASSKGQSRAELWWIDLATKNAQPLANLNGVGYLPTGANGHTDDTTLNYEPTINPVPTGGYAWVVFTSRRLYGNVATVDPFASDPRDYDLSASPTTKKLWVAAVDLNPKPGTDPSHPAFYLPAQELLACNSRGYWVVDACQPDGTTCDTGEECCGGYCEEVDGGYVCTSTTPMCSNINDKCTTTSDCCGAASGAYCLNGRCAAPITQ